MTADRPADDIPAGPSQGMAETGAEGALDAGDVLAALDDALEEHARWMDRWHRALVCRIEPDPDLLADDRHLETRFGRWFAEHAADPLLQQPSMKELWHSYVDLHGLARLLAERARADRPVPTGEYDELIARVDRFRSGARRLRDAFRKAVSELDPLTGLSTRSTMMAELELEYARAQAPERRGHGLAIALADIDHFKQINDRYGHGVGDEVLRAVAGRFLSRLRPTDSIYRYGGEEFLISLPNANAGMARSVLERLRRALEERPIGLEDGSEVAVTASFGVANVTGDTDLQSVMERADQALYAAKEAGRNRVLGWRETDETESGEDADDGAGRPETG